MADSGDIRIIEKPKQMNARGIPVLDTKKMSLRHLFFIIMMSSMCLMLYGNDAPNPFAGPFVDTEKDSGIYGGEFNDVNNLVKLDEKILLSDLETTTSKKIQSLILERLCFVSSLDKYPFLMERIQEFDPKIYITLYACLAGSLVGAPNEEKYDIFLRNRAINEVKKELGDSYVCENAFLTLGMRRMPPNYEALKAALLNKNKSDGIFGDLIKDALEFYKLSPAVIDTNAIKDIDNDELKIIKEIFSKGLPTLGMCDQNNIIVEDGKLKGFWKMINNRWVFLRSGINTSDSPYLSYDFAFTPKRNRAFVLLRIFKGNMYFRDFTYRLDKINGKFVITGLWFTAIG